MKRDARPSGSPQHKNTEPTQVHQLLALAYGDLACFVVAMWPQFSRAPFHERIISKLEAVERGDISRLMIFLPPRHGKSLLGSTHFPAWYLGRHPDHHVIFASYGQELSDDFGRRVRNLLMDPLHQAIFQNCRLSDDSTAAHRFTTTHGGAYFAVGRGGPITGRGADLLIIDDPLKDHEEASSETIRRSLHEWYRSVAYTRLMPGGRIVLIQTRWHEDDLAGRLLREQKREGWELLSMPAIAESDDAFRKEGEPLWPERFPLPQLEQIRAAIGSGPWASLYQQRPTAATGAVFKRNWWQFYRLPFSGPFSRVVQSWDTAFKKGNENDFSVCTTWGVAENGYYLRHLWRGRVEFPELKRVLASLAEQWNPNAILVEDRASGQRLIQELKTSTVLPIIPVKVDTDKQTRAQAVTPLMEAGKIFLPEPESAPWVSDFVEEMACFPNGTYDDCVDSTTQALNYLRQESFIADPELNRIMLGLEDSKELDKEALWAKAMRGCPMTEEEISRM
jgi:predicted phage terminase large subunit-like protein